MSIPDNQSSQGLRDKPGDRSERADELRQAFRTMHGPPSSEHALPDLGVTRRSSESLPIGGSNY